jgi:hypothetical protein
MSNGPVISKSKFLEGVKCLKLLWFELNDPHSIPEHGSNTIAVMEEGKRVGALARSLYNDGIMIGFGHDFHKMHEDSIKAAEQRKPLFEAGFLYKNAFAMADILVPAEHGKWDIIEVKSSTEIKEEHLPDVAFQKYVYEGAGLKINKCYLTHINNQYIKHGEIEADKLLKVREVTESIEVYSPIIEKELNKMVKAAAGGKAPDVEIGQHCNKPHGCPLEDKCWGFLPEENVFILYRGGVFLYELFRKGILSIKDIPLGMKLTDKQIIQINAHRNEREYIDKKELKDFFSNLKYPLHFLDFETLAPAIPIYEGTHAYENIPFQYSLHTIEKEGAEPVHYSHIAKGDVDPRLEIVEKLKGLLGNNGTILAYNASFELRCLRNAGEVYKEYRAYTESLQDRFVDLMTPFIKFLYYSPKQEGSYSMKKVLPALTGKSYEGLEIAEGEMASREYTRVTFDKDIAEMDRQKVYSALEIYCGLDTQGLIDILEALKKKVL